MKTVKNGEESSSGNESEQDKKKFELKLSGVLVNTDEINWDIVKSEVENLYTSIPVITLDLYQFNINQEDILNFNKEYDNLTVIVRNENKEETLAQLSKLYEFLPKFLEHVNKDELYKTIVETKSNIFKGYSKLDSGNWDEIGKDIQNAIDMYSKLLTNTSVSGNKQYTISKGYVMINELQNAVNIKDSAVFLIKYKNLLEELSNI